MICFTDAGERMNIETKKTLFIKNLTLIGKSLFFAINECLETWKENLQIDSNSPPLAS